MKSLDHIKALEDLVSRCLKEDIGQGDITSAATIPKTATATLQLNARRGLVVCGVDVPQMVLEALHSDAVVTPLTEDGQKVEQGSTLVELKGNAQQLLTAERVILNIMQRMSGVATLTHQYVQAVEGTKAKILDTRKTMPGMRILDKYAVRCGGGQNHRMRLDDMVLIKDNHIAVCGSITKAVEQAREKYDLPIEVECDTLVQVKEALKVRPERIMLDNMNNDQLREAVLMVDGAVLLEASGGVNLQTVTAIARTGVSYISVGALTHSAAAVDIGADIEIDI